MSEQPALDFSAPPPPESPAAPGLGSYAQRAYLEYALSVVKGRALPDVCDGQSRFSVASCMPCRAWG